MLLYSSVVIISWRHSCDPLTITGKSKKNFVDKHPFHPIHDHGFLHTHACREVDQKQYFWILPLRKEGIKSKDLWPYQEGPGNHCLRWFWLWFDEKKNGSINTWLWSLEGIVFSYENLIDLDEAKSLLVAGDDLLDLSYQSWDLYGWLYERIWSSYGEARVC